jgi:F0F1-type ATP synthase membrane subunit c/vacuolar-type H+-ATPase subunit K
MYAIDLAYSQYEASLTHERQDVSFIADVTNIGLTGTASLVGVAETKAILAGIAAGLTGVKSSYTNDILFSKTVEVLQTQMRANRAEVATRIIGNLKKPTGVYPIQFALSDLEDYYRAGTLSGAMIAVGATVSAKELVAEQTKAQAIAATIITNPKAPIPPPVRGPSPVEVNRFTDAERILRAEQIKGIQHLFCIPEDGRLGPHGSLTRRKIKEFLVAQGERKESDDDTIDFDGRATLLDALDKGASLCK